MNGYPKLFLPLLISTFCLLWLSGILLMPSMLIFKLEWEITELLEALMELGLANGAIRQVFSVLHATLGWIMLWMLGALWTIHLRNHWRRHENRKHGVFFSLMWLLVILSALGIHYFGDEHFSRLSSILHSTIGILLVLFFIQHRKTGKKSLKTQAYEYKKTGK